MHNLPYTEVSKHDAATETGTEQITFGAWLAHRFNIVPVDTDTNLLSAMRASAAGLHAGQVLNLYPEGHRTFAGELAEFRKGAAILATELKLLIVPVALDGLQHVWPRGAKRIHLAQVKIRFGAPIHGAPASLHCGKC